MPNGALARSIPVASASSPERATASLAVQPTGTRSASRYWRSGNAKATSTDSDAVGPASSATPSRSAPRRAADASAAIVDNRRARYDFFVEETYTAGIALLGWEVKSLRAKRVQLAGSFVLVRPNAAVLHGALITPLPNAMPPVDARRARRLLLRRSELRRLAQATRRRGRTCVCLRLYWQGHLVKCVVALATGKAHRDRRETAKRREWERERQRALRQRATGKR